MGCPLWSPCGGSVGIVTGVLTGRGMFSCSFSELAPSLGIEGGGEELAHSPGHTHPRYLPQMLRVGCKGSLFLFTCHSLSLLKVCLKG